LISKYGNAALCGIGFTMSLFVGVLTFSDAPELQDETKMGVLAGSAFSAVAGAIVFGTARPESRPQKS